MLASIREVWKFGLHMDEWHYQEFGKRTGPVNGEKIQQLQASNTLAPSTLVWKEGMEQWSRIDTISGFETSPYASPKSEASDDVDWSGYAPTGSQVRPWIRHWARVFDSVLFTVIGDCVLQIVSPELFRLNDLSWGMGLMFIYNFVEPAFFHLFGSTPYKALLRVRVRNQDGSKLTYGQALIRTLKIWLRGEALGIPFVSLLTYIAAYNRLKREEITSWDREGAFVVSHQEIEWWRWLVAFSIVPLFIAWVFYTPA